MSWTRRVSLRWRVTAAFAAATGVLLVVLGLFLHGRLASELDASIEAALRVRLEDVSSLVGSDPNADLDQVADGQEGEPSVDVAQVLASDGRLISSEGAFDSPLIEIGDVPPPGEESELLVRERPGQETGRVALLVRRVDDRIVIVGTDERERDEAVAALDRLLLIGLPMTLLLAAVAGAWASRVALAPVERLRERADAIDATTLDERLPEHPADDELRRLTVTLNGMLDRLEEGYRRERAFVDDAAHELRTPLTMLRGELELATNRQRSRDELAASAERASAQTERLVALADNLLVLARGAQGQLALRKEQLAVRDLLANAVDRAGHERVTVSDEVTESTLLADRLRIEQALDNLVGNALRHGAGQVTLGVAHDADATVLTVDDEGGPIDPTLAARAFDRFARGDSARSGSGTGLGLAIVKAIAEAHGGGAGLGANPAGGTRAWLWLPAHI